MEDNDGRGERCINFHRALASNVVTARAAALSAPRARRRVGLVSRDIYRGRGALRTVTIRKWRSAFVAGRGRVQ
jgi:hypothetical protein